MSLTGDDCRRIGDRVLARSKADECSVVIEGGRNANIRFARNEVTTSGDVEDATLTVTASFGKRSGSASVNQFDEATIERCVRQAEETARFAPEDPEHMPVLGPQTYADTGVFDEATAELAAGSRAALAGRAIELAKAKSVVIAGFFTNAGRVSAIASSQGLFGLSRASRVTFAATARTKGRDGPAPTASGSPTSTRRRSRRGPPTRRSARQPRRSFRPAPTP